MVKRYCGSLTITIKYRDPLPGFKGPLSNGDYVCTIRRDGCASTFDRQFVLAPAHLDYAVDSPIAYDRAAHAALSFAYEGDTPARAHFDEAADFSGCGWVIRRTKTHPHEIIGFQGPRLYAAELRAMMREYEPIRDCSSHDSVHRSIQAARDALYEQGDPDSFDHFTRKALPVDLMNDRTITLIGMIRCWYNSRWDH